MAKTVAKMPEVRRGRPEMYPWKDWFNGKAWALKQGEDFKVKPESFKAAVYARKNKLGLVIQTRTVVDADGVATVYVQRLSGAAAASRTKAKTRSRKAPVKKVAA